MGSSFDFESIEGARAAGFLGFETTKSLQLGKCSAAPDEPGVYLAIREPSKAPSFRATSRGGHFKGRDPTVSVADLEKNWVPGAAVLYIGKAGGGASRATLRRRLRSYMRFGQGEPVGHWGGRLIWQLEDCDDLIVAWKREAEARAHEAQLIQNFVSRFGVRPFANLTG